MLTIYSANNRHRVTLAETADGVEFRLWRYMPGERRRAAIPTPDGDPPERFGVWSEKERGLIDVPFHVAADHLYRVVRALV